MYSCAVFTLQNSTLCFVDQIKVPRQTDENKTHTVPFYCSKEKYNCRQGIVSLYLLIQLKVSECYGLLAGLNLHCCKNMIIFNRDKLSYHLN